MLRALIESCEAAGDLIKRLVDCLTAIADCQVGQPNPQGVECLMGVMAGLLGTLLSAAILAALKFNLFDKLKDLICDLKAKIRNALQGVMQKILQWIKDKYTPQRNQKPGEPAKPGLCPLPKPPVSKNKLPKQAKPKKPAKKGGGCGRSAMVPAGNCFPGDALAQLPDGFRRLDKMSVADRLATYNRSERDQFEETAETRVDPDTWRVVTVRQDQGDAGTIEAGLLRPLGFFGDQWPKPGDEFNLDLPRLGLSGPVQVTAIADCPSIPPGPGRIVLSVFRHSRGSTGALYLVGHKEPIRVTALHPVWSPSHNAWIPAGQLTAHHSVSLWKSECPVDRYELDVREEPVYNVEVDGDHCYRAGDSGILVHNASGQTPTPPSPNPQDACNDPCANRPTDEQLVESVVGLHQELGHFLAKARRTTAIAVLRCGNECRFAYSVSSGNTNTGINTAMEAAGFDIRVGGTEHAEENLLKNLPGGCTIVVMAICKPPCKEDDHDCKKQLSDAKVHAVYPSSDRCKTP